MSIATFARGRLRFVLASSVVLIGLFGVACVSRNVERISAEEAAAMAPPPEPIPAGERAASVAQVPGIDGTIDLAQEMGGSSPAGVVYVMVRVAGREQGPPLAVKEFGADFPLTFRISEADSMIPGTPFVGDLDLIVRLDQDANAFSRQDGDLEGSVGPVQVGANVQITLRPAVAEPGDTDSQ